MGTTISTLLRHIYFENNPYHRSPSFNNLNYRELHTVRLGAFGDASACSDGRARNVRVAKVIQLIKGEVWEKEHFDRIENIHVRLTHENIVRFFSSFYMNENRVLWYELVDGEELYEGILDQKPRRSHALDPHSYSTDHVRYYMTQIMSAIKYCHDRNIIHRSISPRRFMLVRGTCTVKLLNVYTAVKMEDDSLIHEYLISSPRYTSPEVMFRSPYGKPADVYSCGLMLYNMLSGIHLVQLEDSIEDITRNQPCGFGRKQWQRVVKDGKDLVRRMLELKQKNRITATDALKHPFFTASSSHRENNDKSSIPAQLRAIAAEEKEVEREEPRNSYDVVLYLLNLDKPRFRPGAARESIFLPATSQ